MKRQVRQVYLMLVLSLAMLWPAQASDAADEVMYRGLSGDKARFKINGRISYLEPDQTGPAGVKLVFADKNEAIIESDKGIYAYKKGDSQGKPLETTVHLRRKQGMFFVRGSINGREIDFLVDTGATCILLNEKQAKRLGIKFRRGKKVDVSTASEKNKAYMITLDSVRVAGIVVNHVVALVQKGRYPEIALLGNTFLHCLDIFQNENMLVLQKK